MRDIVALKSLLSHPVYTPNEREEWLRVAPKLDDASFAELLGALQQKRDLAEQLLQASVGAAVVDDFSQPKITIDEFVAMPSSRLFEPNMARECALLLDQLITLSEMGEAKRFMVALQRFLQDNPALKRDIPELAEQYENVLLRAQWYRFDLLTDEEVDQLLRTKLLQSLREGLPVSEAIQGRMRFYLDLMQFGKERRKVVRALRENTEQIGATPIQKVRGEDGGGVPPTIKNWLNDFEGFFETGKVRTPVDRLTYVNTAANSRRLVAKDRELLLIVLALYDLIVFPPEVYEEISRNISVASAASITQPFPLPAASSSVRVSILETKAEQEENDALLTMITGNYEESLLQLLKITVPTVDDRQRIRVIIRALAQRGTLVKVILAPVMTEMLKHHAESNKKFLSIEQGSDVQKIKLLLRYIFEIVIALDVSASARFGAQVAAWLKTAGISEYQQMTYYDMRQQRFVWA